MLLTPPKTTLVHNGSVLSRSAEISPIAPNGWGQPTSRSGSADLKDLPMRSSRLAYELTSDLQQPTLKYIERDGLQCVIPCISEKWRRALFRHDLSFYAWSTDACPTGRGQLARAYNRQ